jgi:hypothetical protein
MGARKVEKGKAIRIQILALVGDPYGFHLIGFPVTQPYAAVDDYGPFFSTWRL